MPVAKGVFTFRLTAEGVDELKAKLEQLGPAGAKAFEGLKQLSPQLADAMQKAGASADATRAKLEQLPKGLAAAGAGFERAEGAVKSAGRTFNDAVGALQLVVPAAGSAGQAFSALGSVIGGVSDVFGILASGLSKNPFTALVSAAAVAGTVFVAFRSNILGVGDALAAIKPETEAIAAVIKDLDSKLVALRTGGAEGAASIRIAELNRQRDAQLRQLEEFNKRGGSFEVPAGASAVSAITTERETRQQAEALQRSIAGITAELNKLYAKRAELRQLELDAFDPQGEFPKSIQGIKDETERKRQEAEAERARLAQAAAEKLRTEQEKTNREIAALEQRKAEAIDRQNQGVDKYIAKLESEARLAGETAEQREVGRALLEAQAKLVDDLGNKSRDLTETERERVTVAVKAKEAYEAQTKAAEKLRTEMERAAARSTDRLVDFAGDALFDRLTGKATNFWESFRTIGLRSISQLAAEMVFRPLIAPVVGAAVSAAPGLFGIGGGSGVASAATPGASSSGGLGSLVSSPFSSLLSTGGSLLSSAFGGSGGLLQGVGSFIGSALGIGGAGAGAAALGAFSASAFGATAGATGAAAAAAAGSSLAAGGISGAAAGSTAALAGGAAALSPLAATGIGALVAIPAILALSGLFGKKKNVGPFASYAAHLLPDGSLEYKGGGEKNGGSMAQMLEATQALADGIKQVSGVLGIFKLPTLAVGVGNNKTKGTFFGDGGSEAAAVYYGNDPGIAAAAYVRAALQGTFSTGSKIDPSTEAARIFARTTGDAKTDLEFVAVYEGLDKTAAAAATVSRALAELNDKFDKYAELAGRYGLEVERVERARQEALEATVAQLAAPLSDRLAGVRGLIASLQLGPGSPLSAERQLDAARSQFDRLSTSAAGGDEAAQRSLGDAGRAYLDTARGYFGTTEAYAGVYADVLDRLGDIVRDVRDSDPTVRAIVETGERGTAAVAKLLGSLIDEVQALRGEVRRSNDVPFRVIA